MKKMICLAVIILILFFSGCIEKKTNIKDNGQNAIVYSIEELPKDLLMLNGNNKSQRNLLSFLFEGLVKFDEKGNVVPAIAESFDISEDGLIYTFNIRNDAKWSDGKDITAEDFVYFFSMLLSSNIENEYSYQLDYIYGAKNYKKNNLDFKNVAVKAIDKKKLQIRLNSKLPDFIKILGEPIYGLRQNIEKLQDWKNNYENIRFSGPYSIKEIKDNKKVVIEKNKNYWNKYNVQENDFIIVENFNSEAALAQFESSKINIMTNPPLSETKRLLQSKDTLVVYTKDVIGLAFNFKGNSVVKDINFRKAINEFLDPYKIAEVALSEFSVYVDADGFSETKNVFRDNSFKTIKNSSKGIEFLSQVKEKENLFIRLVGVNNDKNKRLIKIISDEIKTMNINVKATLYEKEELNKVVKEGNFDIIINEYEQHYNSELDWLEKWSTNFKDNIGKYSNADYDEKLKKAQFEDDISKRRFAILACEYMLKEELPVIPLFYDVNIVLKSEDIEDLNIGANGILDITNIYRDEATSSLH